MIPAQELNGFLGDYNSTGNSSSKTKRYHLLAALEYLGSIPEDALVKFA